MAGDVETYSGDVSVETVGEQGPLPRGKHGLTREQVEASQYRRLCTAVLDAVGELGFAATTVADIVTRAQVARRTFYSVFGGKDECFAAAYDLAVGAALEQLRETVTGLEGVNFAERVRISFEIYLNVLALQPGPRAPCMSKPWPPGRDWWSTGCGCTSGSRTTSWRSRASACATVI